MDLLEQIILIVVGGLVSGGVVFKALLFFRQNRRHKKAQADVTAIEALGAAIELLSKENKRLSFRLDGMHTELVQLHKKVRSALAENARLAERLEQMRVLLRDFQKGILLLTNQVVEAQMEPVWTIPEYMAALLTNDFPLFGDRSESKP